MGEIRDYKDLRVWRAGMDLAEDVYKLTRAFPSEERYGLTAQVRRAAASVRSNIAEGYGRHSTGQYLHFLAIAHGSALEVETQLLLALRVGCCADDDASSALAMAGSTARQLRALMKSVEGSPKHE